MKNLQENAATNNQSNNKPENQFTNIVVNVPLSFQTALEPSKELIEEITKDSIAVWQHSVCDIIAELGLELIETSGISERRCEEIGERLTFFTTLNKGFVEALENMDAHYYQNYQTVKLREVRPNTTLPELLAEVMNHPSIDADLWNKLNDLLPDTMVHSPELIKKAIQTENDALDLSECSPESLNVKLSDIHKLGNGELATVISQILQNPNIPEKLTEQIGESIIEIANQSSANKEIYDSPEFISKILRKQSE